MSCFTSISLIRLVLFSKRYKYDTHSVFFYNNTICTILFKHNFCVRFHCDIKTATALEWLRDAQFEKHWSTGTVHIILMLPANGESAGCKWWADWLQKVSRLVSNVFDSYGLMKCLNGDLEWMSVQKPESGMPSSDPAYFWPTRPCRPRLWTAASRLSSSLATVPPPPRSANCSVSKPRTAPVCIPLHIYIF